MKHRENDPEPGERELAMPTRKKEEAERISFWRRLAPRHAVIAYFGCFAIGWLALALGTHAMVDPGMPRQPLRPARDPAALAALMLVLAVHAAAVALIAWKAQHWLATHGMLAVLVAGLPLVVLLHELWFVPAFLYLIAVLHVGLAVQHESRGRLQAPHRPATEPRAG